MSGFITGTGVDGFDRAADGVTRDRQRRQQIGVDTAIREGVGEMMRGGGQGGGYQPPMAAPWTGSAYQPPGAATAPVAAPAASLTPAPTASATTAQPAPGATLPTAQPEDPRFARLRMGTIRVEDPTGRAVNPWGFTGFYQFGTGALKDAGVYEPSQGEDLKRNAWTGTINLPSGKRLTHAEFSADPDAQKEAWDAHQARLGTEIDRRGLNRYIGQTRGGIPITEDAIRAMMHIGGAHGAQLFLTTDGAYNPADANGTTLSAYATKVLSGQDGVSAGRMGGSTPSVGGMGLFQPGGAQAAPGASQGASGASYNPILSRLAQTPGGGATALSILGQQSRADMAQGRRSDAYQRLAMTALGKGDVGLFQYYAQRGGLNIPQEVIQNAGMRQRLSIGSLTAERLYRDDPQRAAIFVQAYMQGGDVGQAYRMAGPPQGNPQITVKEVYDAETNTIQLLGIQTRGPQAGMATPITTPGGQSVAGDARAGAANNAPRLMGDTYMVPGPNGTWVPATDADGNPIRRGAGPNSVISSAYNATRTAVYQDPLFMARPTAEKDAEIERQMRNLYGPDWQSQMRGTAGQGTATPAATPTTTPAPQELPPDGTIIRQGGRRYRIENRQPVLLPE